MNQINVGPFAPCSNEGADGITFQDRTETGSLRANPTGTQKHRIDNRFPAPWHSPDGRRRVR
jgi:hypothetical protein